MSPTTTTRGPHSQSSPGHLPHSAFLRSSFWFTPLNPTVCLFSISSKGLPAQLVVILPEQRANPAERKRNIAHQTAGHPYLWCVSPIFFTSSMADLYAHSLPCSTFSRFSLSFSSLYARAHTFAGLLLVWLTGIEKGKS